MTKYQSSNWLSSINAVRQISEPDWNALKHPILPWISYQLHPKIRELFLQLGIRRKLNAGEVIFKYGEPIQSIAMVSEGITARRVGQNQDCAMAISIPGRFAFGNLNFFTSLSCIGSYYALVPSEIVVVSQKIFQQVLFSDIELTQTFCKCAELAALSDRLTFAILSMQPVEERIKSFYLAWAANYAHLESGTNDEDWLVMPPTIQRRYLRNIVHASRFTLDTILRSWKASGQFLWFGNSVRIRPSFLEDAYRWMRRMEEAPNDIKTTKVVNLFSSSKENWQGNL